MAKNSNDFFKELDAEFEEVKKEVGDKYKQTALDFLSYVTSPPPKGTPIDTGFTSNSWHISLNNESVTAVGVPRTKTGANTAKARQERSVEHLKNTDVERINKIYINNPNDWISDLNAGTSRQSPGGFVELGKQYAESRVK